MDTSKEYIEMCMKAVEIQACWVKPKNGDVFVDEHNDHENSTNNGMVKIG